MQQVYFGRSRGLLRTLAISLAALATILVSQFVAAEAQTGRPMFEQPILGAAKPTPAWINFCRHHPADCAVEPGEPARFELTPATWAIVDSINSRVNAAVHPATDKEHWGVEDRWDFAEDGYGDCEDYQILKRRLLVKAGLPRRALRMTVVVDEVGDGHAVLTARTNRGDFILDNKRDAVLPWSQSGYVFVKREGSEGSAWVSLGGRASPRMTANR